MPGPILTDISGGVTRFSAPSARRSHHRRVRTNRITVLAVALLALPVAACGGDGGSRGRAAAAGGTSTTLPRGDADVRLDPSRFTSEIDNPWFPLRPGTRWTYREVDADWKRIAGIDARVVRDTVRQDGQVLEDTFDFYAQDDDGNVWYMGEDTAEFEDGRIATREGSFEAGVDGAQAGIAMPGHPRPGQRYRQEFRKGEAEDQGAVLSTDELVEASIGRYQHAVLTRDTNPLEPHVSEYKLFAEDVGLVLTLDVSGGSGREDLLRVDSAPAGAGTGPLGSP
jgi:hypothetical protein